MDPAEPIITLPSRVATTAGELVAAIAPAAFALLAAAVVLLLAVQLVRRSL